jgi:transcriptional regulator with XRE-family HTH domain
MPRTTPLAVVRRRRLLSQRQLAEAAGLSHTVIVDIETGKSRPRGATMRKIADALDVSVDQIAEFKRAIEAGPRQLELAA